jgi:hypothetical protein
MVGGLKASVTQLESEKEDLKREVAELKAQNRRISNNLVEERSRNGELATRLDGARNILRSQGLDRAELSDSVPELDDGLTSRRGSPIKRPAPKPRKTPFAEIPGLGSSDGFEDRGGNSDVPRNSRGDEDFLPQARRDVDARWLPVTPGVSEPGTTRFR